MDDCDQLSSFVEWIERRWPGKSGCAALALLVLLSGSTAGAATPSAEKKGDVGASNSVSLTLSTLNLAKPVISDEEIRWSPEVEIMGEVNLGDVFGVAGLVSYGRAIGNIESTDFSFDVFRFGAQGLWYPVGHFDNGMQLGVHGLHLRTSTSGQIDDVSVDAAGTATAVSGLIGYKAIVDPGFTLVCQLGGGAQFIHARASGETDDAEARAETTDVAPHILFNINLGWSF